MNKVFYERTFDVATDAGLIKELTRPEEEVCLISSFDVALLIQAQRKALFYRTPFIKSSFFQSKDFQNTTIELKDEYQYALSQLFEKKPRYVFIEKRILFNYGAHEGHSWLPEFKRLLSQHYQIEQKSKYLVALKRVVP